MIAGRLFGTMRCGMRAAPLPFLGVSSRDFGPLFGAVFSRPGLYKRRLEKPVLNSRLQLLDYAVLRGAGCSVE